MPEQARIVDESLKSVLDGKLDEGQVETDTLFEVIEEALLPVTLDISLKGRLRRALGEVALGFSPASVIQLNEGLLGEAFESGEDLAAALFQMAKGEDDKGGEDKSRNKAQTKTFKKPEIQAGSGWSVREQRSESALRENLKRLKIAEETCARIKLDATQAACVAVASLYVPKYWIA